MDSILQTLEIANASGQVSIEKAVLTFLLASCIGMFISYIYRFNAVAFSVERQFTFTLTTICVIVAVVMSVIGSNLVLSLGLIGALSIIRFRSVIKNTVDMSYLFWAIAEGLSVGAGAYTVTFVSTIGLAGLMILLRYMQRFPEASADYILTIQTDGNQKETFEEAVMSKLPTNVELTLKSAHMDKMSNNYENTFEVRSKNKENFASLIEALEKNAKVKKVIVLHPETNLYI